MMEAVKGILAELGVLPEQIRTEVFIGKERPLAPATTLPEDRAATPVGRAEPPAGAAAPLAVITFARSKKTAMLPPEKSILEASEDVGVNIDYSCRVGTCGACKTKLLSGSVTMAVQDGLDPGDKENNIILACQAKSTGDVSVDAYVPRDQVKDAGPTGL
jgi:glycine betaine catabolism B